MNQLINDGGDCRVEQPMALPEYAKYENNIFLYILFLKRHTDSNMFGNAYVSYQRYEQISFYK